MRVLAIDPGYDRLGIAILDSGEQLIHSECLTTSKKILHAERLKKVGLGVRCLIEKYKPDTVALESLFFSTNRKTAMKVAEVRGVLLYETALSHCELVEYSPADIKIAVTGYGRSSKEQIMTMVKRLVKHDFNAHTLDDEYDAIALGLTHLASVTYKKLSTE